ncbi:hypothetical protein ScPMuIL_005116 [Solemya velum]
MDEDTNYFAESPLKRLKFDSEPLSSNLSPSPNYISQTSCCNKDTVLSENVEMRHSLSAECPVNMAVNDEYNKDFERKTGKEDQASLPNEYTEVSVFPGDLDKADDSDNLSEVSNLSGLSEEAWRPLAGPMSWVQRQMSLGKDPRVVLHELIPTDTPIPEDIDDFTLWKIVINLLAEPEPRKKLSDINTLGDVLSLLKKSRNIIVLTGAGVSVSCGIPDFRSRDGIYARLAVDFPDLPDPQAMFDIHYFTKDPRPFFKFAKEIYPGQFEPSRSHKFIKLIEDHGKLLRNYTQNIDTLEQVAGITKAIQCHGSFATATCVNCKYNVDCHVIEKDIFNQVIPQCPKCSDGREMSVMKPDIVFFGESLPEKFHKQMAEDKEKCDLLIVIGSSLKVRPVALIPNSLPADIPQILINREPLRHLQFDVELLGDCDVILNELCRRLGDQWAVHCDKPALEQIDRCNLDTPPPQTVFADNEAGWHKNGSHSSWKNVNTKTDAPQSNHHLRKQCDSLTITSDSADLNPEVEKSSVQSISKESTENISKEGSGISNTECKQGNIHSANEDNNAEQDIRYELDDAEREIERLFSVQRRDSLAKRLKENQFLFLPPSRYVFCGAEIMEDFDSELDTSSSCSDSFMNSGENSSSSPPQEQLAEMPNMLDTAVSRVDNSCLNNHQLPDSTTVQKCHTKEESSSPSSPQTIGEQGPSLPQ